jgi:glycosyltransferase involved in cell wall biosynthesis
MLSYESGLWRLPMTAFQSGMRIGIVSGEYPPMQGGVGDFAASLARHLASQGNDVHVVTQHVAVEEEGQPEVAVHRLRTSWRWGCWRGILQLARGLELDVVNLHYQAAAYRMRAGINLIPRSASRPPVVVTFHDLRVPYLFPKAGSLRWRVVRLLAESAEGVIATNEEDYRRLESEVGVRNLALIPIGSTIPVVPGVDRAAERRKWGAGPEDLLVGHFGFLNESKGVEELLEAAKLLIEGGLSLRLLMIGGRLGSSDPTNELEAARVDEMVRRLGLKAHVTWTGYLGRNATSAALGATDLCVLPYRDGASFRRTTLLACLAHERAVVTTLPRVPLEELRDGQTALLVEPHHAGALADTIARVAGDAQLRERLESGAARLAEQFSWERITRQTNDFLKGLVHEAV